MTSHTAIIARSLNIPSIVAMHHARQLIYNNDNLIVDGGQGVVIVNPDKYVLAEYRLKQNHLDLEKRKLKRLKSIPTMTLDGTSIELHANIELPQDVEQVKESGAIGIGLFRSEFLFLNRDDLPSEDEQFEAYSTVAQNEVWLIRNGRRVNAKSIMGVMTLAANKGSTVAIEITGADETEAMQALTNLINGYFGEGE